jgi:hypothetical protein
VSTAKFILRFRAGKIHLAVLDKIFAIDAVFSEQYYNAAQRKPTKRL